MQTTSAELYMTLLVLELNEAEARTTTTSVGIEITDEKIGM
jgi:hypothetical protein